MGTDQDCKSNSLADMKHDYPGYTPYRVSGDFNRDGIEDAAVVLIRGDSGQIYWFRGMRSGYAAPLLLGSIDWARDGGLYARGGVVGFGILYSDVVFSWAWDSVANELKIQNDSVSQ